MILCIGKRTAARTPRRAELRLSQHHAAAGPLRRVCAPARHTWRHRTAARASPRAWQPRSGQSPTPPPSPLCDAILLTRQCGATLQKKTRPRGPCAALPTHVSWNGAAAPALQGSFHVLEPALEHNQPLPSLCSTGLGRVRPTHSVVQTCADRNYSITTFQPAGCVEFVRVPFASAHKHKLPA